MGTVSKLFAAHPLIHVAVMCPPEAAVTVLLNKMTELGAMFTLLTHVPVQVGTLTKANGQANVAMFPVLVFAVAKNTWETFIGRTYNPMDMFQLDQVLGAKLDNINPLVN